MEIDSELRSKETWLVSEDGLWDIELWACFVGMGTNHLFETSTLVYQLDNGGIFPRNNGRKRGNYQTKNGLLFYR